MYVTFTHISFAALKWDECLSVQLPFELPVQIPVQLGLELEANWLDQNVNELEFELVRLECRWNDPKWSLMSLVLFCKNQKCSKKDSNNNHLSLEKEGRSWERKLSTCTVGLYYCVLLRSLAITTSSTLCCLLSLPLKNWVNTTKKENLTFFLFLLQPSFPRKLVLLCKALQETRKKGATASKTVQLAKQHISKSCD